jgi:hypothetical protein
MTRNDNPPLAEMGTAKERDMFLVLCNFRPQVNVPNQIIGVFDRVDEATECAIEAAAKETDPECVFTVVKVELVAQTQVCTHQSVSVFLKAGNSDGQVVCRRMPVDR